MVCSHYIVASGFWFRCFFALELFFDAVSSIYSEHSCAACNFATSMCMTSCVVVEGGAAPSPQPPPNFPWRKAPANANYAVNVAMNSAINFSEKSMHMPRCLFLLSRAFKTLPLEQHCFLYDFPESFVVLSNSVFVLFMFFNPSMFLHNSICCLRTWSRIPVWALAMAGP